MNIINVLHIDDSPEDRMLIKRVFTKENGFEYYEAETAEAALDWLAKNPVDCILLDYSLPGMSGLEFIEKINRDYIAFTEIPIVMFSGGANQEDIINVLKSGALDFVSKEQVASGTLVRSIQNAVEKAHLRKRLQEEKMLALHNSKLAALGLIAGGVAHEINNPLTILQGQLMFLQKHLDAGDLGAIKELMANIQRASKRIAMIVNGLNSFCGELKRDEPVVVMVREIFELAQNLCTERAKVHQCELYFDMANTDIKVKCGAAQVAQVLLNLIMNAMQAIRTSEVEEKRIEVSAIVNDDKVELRVKDSGPGIPEELRHQIFDPFFTTKEVGTGTGLGLSISQGTVRKYAGELTLDEKSKQTQFIVRFPIYSSKKTSDSEAA